MSESHDNVPTSSVLRINDAKTRQLLKECENAECLWNTNLFDYPNREKRMLAYEVIAEKLGIPNFTPHHVMVKFKNLRNSYCQELKKMAAHKNYKPKVFWFKQMDSFLRPHLQKIKTYSEACDTNNFSLEPKEEVITEVDSDDQGCGDGTAWVTGHPTQSDASCSYALDESKSKLCKQDTETRSTSVKAKRRKFSLNFSENEFQEIKQSESDNEDIFQSQETGDPLTGISSTIQEIDEAMSKVGTVQVPTPAIPQADHFDAFGNYIASLLRSLPPKKALKLQPKIVNLVVSVGLEDESGNDSET